MPERSFARLQAYVDFPISQQSFVRPVIAAAERARCVEPGRLVIPDRREAYSSYRQMAMWITFHITLRSMSDIAREFKRDQSTFIWSLRRAEWRLEQYRSEAGSYVRAVLRELHQGAE